MPEADIIAIDGPSASGKSTVARELAKALDYIYVDSGSLYRGITWLALEKGVDVTDAESVIALLEESTWDFFESDRVVGFHIDEAFPGKALREQRVVDVVSHIAGIPEVRQFIVDHLRKMVTFGPLVIEGRDIGTVVFPDTDHKFYIDADPDERARRRSKDNQAIGEAGDVAAVLDSLVRRDTMDSQRETAPLQVALGAEVINTTHMDVAAVVEHIRKKIQGG